MSIGAYQSEIARSEERQRESLNNPDGVSYMNQLWDIVESETSPLAVTLRTDQTVFDAIPVPAHWAHGRYGYQNETGPEKSTLIFGVPDWVTNFIQSAHARTIARRFFGQDQAVVLDAAILPDRTDDEGPQYKYGHDTNHEVIVDDWPKLKEAIRMTAADRGRWLNGQTVKVANPNGQETVVPARVQDKRLELHLGENIVDDIHALWSQAFRREVLLEESSR